MLKKSNEILFAEWIAENHFRLYDVKDGVFIWKNETDSNTKDFIYASMGGKTFRHNPSLTKISKRVKGSMYSRLSQTVRGVKSNTFYSKFGYTQQELMRSLESKFRGCITWDNYGSYWHIDHIKPVSHFDWKEDKVEKTIKECWALDNLQPLPAALNSIKGNRYIG